MLNYRFKRKGFTLLEMLLSIAILTLLAGLSVPIYRSFYTKNDLNLSSETLVHALRRAQSESQGVLNDSSRGVYIESGNIRLFSGSSYATRDVNLDENFEIPQNIQLSGLNEVVFDKVSGLPQATGEFILTSVNNEVSTTTINSMGTIFY